MCRMLECKKCRLRHVYQSLASREICQSDVLNCGPLRPRHHFHKLTRLIKAVNVASQKQSILYRCGGSFLRFPKPIASSAVHQPAISRKSRVRRWICKNHATDLFRYLFYAADDAVDDLELTQVNSARPAKWTDAVFPKGQTEFYFRGLSKFERAATAPCFRPTFSVPNLLINDADFITPTCGLMLLLGSKPSTEPAEPAAPELDIPDANRRWSEAYGELDSPKCMKDCIKTVHFPKFNPVVGTRQIIAYNTASRLLRKDRTWEFHFMDRLREGNSPSDDEFEEEERRLKAESDSHRPEETVPSPGQSEASSCQCASSTDSPKKRRLRRKRKRSNRESRSSTPSPIFSAVNIWQNLSSTPLCLDTVCSILLEKLYSEQTSQSTTSAVNATVISTDFRVAATISPDH